MLTEGMFINAISRTVNLPKELQLEEAVTITHPFVR